MSVSSYPTCMLQDIHRLPNLHATRHPPTTEEVRMEKENLADLTKDHHRMHAMDTLECKE